VPPVTAEEAAVHAPPPSDKPITWTNTIAAASELAK